MSKKSMIAVCLCGLAWAGTAQAGFLGNNLELQFLHNLTINSTPPVHIFDGINNDVGNVPGFNVNVGDTSLLFDVPTGLPQIGVTISNIIPTISDATGTCNNDCVSFDNNTNSLTIDPLSSGREIVTLTVPEPGAFDLMALGLTILGMTIYQRKRASAKAACGEFSVIRG